MRKLSVLTVIALFISLTAKSQIEVNASGQVGIADYTIKSGYDLSVNDLYAYDLYSFYSDSYYLAALGGIQIGASAGWSNYRLYVNGSASFIGEVYVNGQLVHASDERLKKNKKVIDDDDIFRKIKKVNGWRYEFKDSDELLQMHNSGELLFPIDTIHKQKKDSIKVITPKFGKGVKYGLLAQEIEKEFPELVVLDSTSMIYGVDYIGFIPILLNAVKSQQVQIEDLERRLIALEKKSN